MAKEYNYVTNLDIKFDHLQLIDIPQLVQECTDKWFNQTLTKVNDSVVRLGIELHPDQGVTITKGIMHRPRAPKKTVMLMVETSTIQPTGS
jgi:hypothetical protein